MEKQWKQWETLFWGAPKSLEMVTEAMKLRHLLHGRKVMTNLNSILKSRDITLPTKVCLVKAMVFTVVMYGCESWIVKKAEHRRITAFQLWCWRTLESPLDCKEMQPVHPKEDQSWVIIDHWLMLKLKLQYFGHLMWRADSFEKTLIWERLKVGKEGDDRGWDGWMASLTQWTWVWVNSRSWWWAGRPGVLQSTGWQSQTRLSDWTVLQITKIQYVKKFCQKIKEMQLLFNFSLGCFRFLKSEHAGIRKDLRSGSVQILLL